MSIKSSEAASPHSGSVPHVSYSQSHQATSLDKTTGKIRNDSLNDALDRNINVPFHRLMVIHPKEHFSEEQIAVSHGIRKQLSLRARYLFHHEESVLSDFKEATSPIDSRASPAPDPSASYSYKLRDGIVRVIDSDTKKELVPIPTFSEFQDDLNQLWLFVKSAAAKSHSYHRLLLLEKKFEMYTLLNESYEYKAITSDPQDFMSIHKVDNHLHLDASYTSYHLLQFIREKAVNHGNDIVWRENGKDMTLSEVFKSMGIDVTKITLDNLNVSSRKDFFHRFDFFNAAYNPFGEEKMRTIFMSPENIQKGKYFAEVIGQVFDLAKQGNISLEPRLTLFGKSRDELDMIAEWVVTHDLMPKHVRWMLQVPRIFPFWLSQKALSNFQQMLDNIYIPLFEVTVNPASHPYLAKLLEHVVGFDSVDDESPMDELTIAKETLPEEWNSAKQPPYHYYMYYKWASLFQLNWLRKRKGLNTFTMRPHAGEAGPVHHLATAFLLADSINHGIKLCENPTMQYLYYLARVPLSMSPVSNNNLFVKLDQNPFYEFFKRGLVVTLSTDDPMQFHTTKEPLIEEYSIAKQFWKLSTADLSEIAWNSVIQSGFSVQDKMAMIGPAFMLPGANGNDTSYTNIPDCRPEFRFETFVAELQQIWRSSRLSDQAGAGRTEIPASLTSWKQLVSSDEIDNAVCLWVAENDYNLPNSTTGQVLHPTHLTLRKGFHIVVKDKEVHPENKNLWLGVDHNGRAGFFPFSLGKLAVVSTKN